MAGAMAAPISLIQSPSNASAGQPFNIDVVVDPDGSAIAGTQLNIGFDSSLMKVNSVTEGDLFSQSGTNTFFNHGDIDNQAGTITNIYGAILGPRKVNTRGTFIIINATAIEDITDAAGISLSNVMISTPEGAPVMPTGAHITPAKPAQTNTGNGNGEDSGDRRW